MIIRVNELGTIEPDKVVGVRYIEVEGVNDSNEARPLAFRAVNKRREKDYNELVHNTSEVKIETNINRDFADFLRKMT